MASVVIGAALMVLAVSTLTGVLSVLRANHQVEERRAVLTPYHELQRAVAAEAAAEAGYRRAPSAEARVRLEESIAEVPVAVARVRELADRRDRATLSYVELLNGRYVTQVRATLDSPQGARRDDRVAGPALDAMLDLLDAAVSGHRGLVTDAVDRQEAVLDRLSVQLPITFALAFLVLAWSWRSMLLAHRRLRTEAARQEERALTDALTRLPNREALRIAAEQALARPRTRAALLFLDLDRFKPVNDTYGHAVGDLLLQKVAERLTSTLRAGEVAARFGGDEFAVFLPRAFAAPQVARRILTAIEQPFLVDGHQVSVGTSIGVARFPEDAGTYEELLRAADHALYEAKHAGRGRITQAASA